ncbi:uncharacterized protein LOC119990932 isoform X2 [Tripterygium wilfordii]|uniref:uncharacterized protein LOC119990932 isoform X2 n=1 Tax=Tripterygium wilfordii TaxID=458696 RepID=UPI0018F84C81|nr:uncharacterized protein LOC119990932 isoform X2 [Tripterygium wilfordii]
MQKTAQAWFMRGPSGITDQQKSSSLLADWNAYAALQEPDSSASGFDLEAAVRTSSDKVTGTLNVVSKGVRDIPGNFQSSSSNVPASKSFMYFGLLLATGVFFVFVAFTMFLPVMVLAPQKFAMCLTIGCAFIVCSFFALKGLRNQLLHMLSKEVLALSFYAISYFPGGSAGLKFLSSTFISSILECFRR